MDENRSVYIISSAADLLGVHPRTLHVYEEKGLIVPVRKGNRRFYSANDLQWIRAIRYLVHERGINLEGLRQVLALRAHQRYLEVASDLPGACLRFASKIEPCWEKGAAELRCHDCPVYLGARDSLQQDQRIPRLST